MAHFLREVDQLVAAFEAPVSTLQLGAGGSWSRVVVEQLRQAPARYLVGLRVSAKNRVDLDRLTELLD